MFTGLIEEIGRINRIEPQGNSARLHFSAPGIGSELTIGESIAVNGACLTVETCSALGFRAFASQETLGCTTLANAAIGQAVNLERALRMGDRLGGHQVSGHVDALGTLAALRPSDDGWILQINAPAAILSTSIPKGSISVDGISLTIVDLTAHFFTVAVIPETYKATILHRKQPGDKVNLESDLIGKYVSKMLGAYGGETRQASPPSSPHDLLFGSISNRK